MANNSEKSLWTIFIVALTIYLLTNDSIEIVQKVKLLILNNILLFIILAIIILIWRTRK